MAQRDGLPTLSTLFASEQHLVIHCRACDWQMRCTPEEACALFGPDTTFEAARRRVKGCPRCGATGFGGECQIDLRACMSDFYARGAVERAWRQVEDMGQDPREVTWVQRHRIAWRRRKPREPGTFDIRLKPEDLRQ